jgi:hypothetical protein
MTTEKIAYTYEIITDQIGNETLKRTDPAGVVAWIPLELANSDYKDYLDSQNEA